MAHVYLDYNATTPLDERVLTAMLPFLREQYGNAASRHELGTVARKAIDHAREQVAALVNVQPSQVVFTSGGTEANNLFIRGAADYLKPSQIAISAIEHSAVTQPALALTRNKWKLHKFVVHANGQVDLNDVDAALKKQTGIVSVMLANNETGVIQEVAAIAERARNAGAWMHTDAVQALGKMPVDFDALGVHAMSLSAHKIYGPKGAGALIYDKRISLRPLLAGGGHEAGLRSGTENVAAIVGFGVACELAAKRMTTFSDCDKLAALRESLEHGLTASGAIIFGAAVDTNTPRVANTSYFAFPDVDGETLVIELDKAGFAVASGAACSSTSTEPSPTLLAMGVEPALARGAVRVSLGRDNRAEQIEWFLHAVNTALAKLKRLTAIAV